MTNAFGFQGAVLVVIGLLLALVAYLFSHWQLRIVGGVERGRLSLLNFWQEDAGVSVLYFLRGVVNSAGSATPPTAQQAAQVQKQTAQVVLADADTQALFTHNMGLDASAPAFFEPEIFYYPQLTTAGGTYLTGLTFDVTNTNVVKVNKANFLGSGGTFIVTVRRPHSAGQ